MDIDTRSINGITYNGASVSEMWVDGVKAWPLSATDYSREYLTFVALEDNMSVGLTNAGNNVFQYSTDSGSTWGSLHNNEFTTLVNSGQTIMFKATGVTVGLSYGIGTFKPSVSASVEGNVMSLIYGDDFIDKEVIANRQFRHLFYGATNITSAENLVLPATTLTDYCYHQMFRDCTSLATAPKLPATTLAQFCYNQMFYGCTSLTRAPQLPATTLANSCYNQMFASCTSLTTAPELSATTLVRYCYSGMFNGCTSLTTAPQLPATTLVEGCYNIMFRDCTSLTTAPQLPATTLTDYCYQQMFYGCSSLNSITCLATDISATNCLNSWVNDVASSGTFTKASSMTSWTSGDSGIPENWIVVNS